MSFDLPRDVVLPVEDIDVRLDPTPHPLEQTHMQAIDANWAYQVSVNPHLFDGRVALLSELSYAGGRLVGRCHIVRYATFMYWRGNREMPGVGHVFAHAMLVSSDNALVAIRMGKHTLNAGRVYFAAGSFELDDFRDGLVDVDFNMRREVKEETGIDIGKASPAKRYYLLSTRSGTVIFRRYRMPMTANAMIASINAFVAAETDPEIEAPVVIHSAGDLPDHLAAHMKPLIEWHFANEG